jgi:hypothetical protein
VCERGSILPALLDPNPNLIRPFRDGWSSKPFCTACPEPETRCAQLKANLLGSELTLWDKTEDAQDRKGFGAEALCTQFRAFGLETGKDKEAEEEEKQEKGKASKDRKKPVPGPERSMWITLGAPGGGWKPSEPDGGADSLSSYLELARDQPDQVPPEMARHVRVLTVRAPEQEKKGECRRGPMTTLPDSSSPARTPVAFLTI